VAVYEDSFGRVPWQYDAVRPNYPQNTIDRFIALSDLGPGDSIVEFGAGTGILTEQLVREGLLITVVEPDKNLRRVAANRLREPIADGKVQFIGETAMDAANQGLLAPSYNGAAIGTARKWVDRDGFRAMLHEILRPARGDRAAACVGALHNTTAVRDLGGDTFFDASREIYQTHMKAGTNLPHAADLKTESFGEGFVQVPPFSYDLDSFSLNADDYTKLINTYGPIIKLPTETRAALNEDLTELINSEQFGGRIALTHAVTLDVYRRIDAPSESTA
jgi:hypothetical protein